MSYKQLKKRTEGFTIIEVLIVLAIAGLIMLIVFLAVPALQRNSRNTQRTTDAARMASAVSECLNNNNGQTGECDDFAAPKLDGYIDLSKNQQLNNLGAPGLDTVEFNFGYKCNAAGNDKETGGSRSFTLLFVLEVGDDDTNNAVRCVES